MNFRLIPILLLATLCASLTARGQGDFLSQQEEDLIRDAQEPEKRIILYLNFAQDRLDNARDQIASKKPDSGKAAQKNLKDYVAIMDAVDTTIQTARDKNEPATKGLEQIKTRGAVFLKFLQAIQADPALDHTDYQFTLEEAIDMTQDEMAEAKKGSFPAIRPKEPSPPPPANQPPASSSGNGDDEGPPRKKK